MQYREYGKTGKKISALGFGAMRLPKDDEDYAVEIMRRYLDLGGNLIDTARGYGESEKIVGRALKGRRDQVYLSTKNHSIMREVWEKGCKFSSDDWQRMVDESFEALQVDRIDFYHVHSITWQKYVEHFQPPSDAFKMIRRAQEEGRIEHLCFSSHDTPENIIKLIDEGIFDGILVQYNMLDRVPGAGGHGAGVGNEPALAHAAEKGLGVMIMGPVAGGRLMRGPSDKIEKMMGGEFTSIPDLALRFVLANPNVTGALSGMNTLEMVEENCATASREEPLSEQELAAIRQAIAENEKLAELYCTGCGYCQPCPEGVAIPDIFQAMNYHRVWGLTDLAKHQYSRLGPDNDQGKLDASACVECGECEEKCPQHIPIIEQLKECHQVLSEAAEV